MFRYLRRTIETRVTWAYIRVGLYMSVYGISELIRMIYCYKHKIAFHTIFSDFNFLSYCITCFYGSINTSYCTIKKTPTPTYTKRSSFRSGSKPNNSNSDTYNSGKKLMAKRQNLRESCIS